MTLLSFYIGYKSISKYLPRYENCAKPNAIYSVGALISGQRDYFFREGVYLPATSPVLNTCKQTFLANHSTTFNKESFHYHVSKCLSATRPTQGQYCFLYLVSLLASQYFYNTLYGFNETCNTDWPHLCTTFSCPFKLRPMKHTLQDSLYFLYEF